MVRIGVGDGPIFEIGIVEDQDAAGRRQLQQTREQRQRGDKRTGLVLAAGVIGLAIAALILIPFFTKSDPDTGAPLDDAIDPQEAAAERDAGPASSDVGQVSGDTPEADPSADGAFQPPSASHLRADEVASLFIDQLDAGETQYGIAYVADRDFIVLDERGITVPELQIAQDFNTVSNYALLTSDGRTWAINTRDRDLAFLVSNSYVVVVSERPGTIAVINPDNLEAIGILSAGLPVPSVQLPEGADLLWVQGRGPLVLPRTGGTFEVLGTATSLTRISDERAVAASLQSTVFERCSDDLSCAYFVTVDGEEAEFDLPSDSATFSPSPDGSWILAVTGDVTTLIETRTQRQVALAEGAPTAVAWAPDGSFVAVVRDDVLEIRDPAADSSTELQLNHTPNATSLLAFAS